MENPWKIRENAVQERCRRGWKGSKNGGEKVAGGEAGARAPVTVLEKLEKVWKSSGKAGALGERSKLSSKTRGEGSGGKPGEKRWDSEW